MRLLLDTHIVVWALLDSPRLSPKARELIGITDNKIFVSAASIWEIAIKRAAGKQNAPSFSSLEAIGFLKRAGYTILDITVAHCAAVEKLPLLHRDPFDRLLVAQALTEPLVLLTRDPKVACYGGSILSV